MKFILMIMASMITTGIAPAGNWKPDAANAKVSFSVKGPFGTVNGDFSGLKSEIQFNEKDLPGSSVTASVDAGSVSTGIGLRNRDLRKKEEWLDADKYPTISFHSKKIEKTNTGYKAIGELNLKGVTKPAEIPFTFAANGDAGVFKGQFKIKREDYHIGKSGGSVGSEVTLTLEIPVKK